MLCYTRRHEENKKTPTGAGRKSCCTKILTLQPTRSGACSALLLGDSFSWSMTLVFLSVFTDCYHHTTILLCGSLIFYLAFYFIYDYLLKILALSILYFDK